VQLSWTNRLLNLALICAVGSFVLVPLVILVLYSFSRQWNYPALVPTRLTLDWYAYVFEYERALEALWLSVRLAVVTTLAALMVGVPAGYVLARQRFRGRAMLELLFLAKTAVPVIVVGVGTAAMFIRLQLYDTFHGLVLAHLVGALPYMIWTSAAAFEGVAHELEQAAHDLGAGWWRTFAEIALPLALPGILAGSILVFLFSMDEFTITFLVSGIRYNTLPLSLYSTLQQGFIEPASATAVLLLIPSLLYLVIVVRFLRLSDLSAGFGRSG
jgi:ABC-type spermidine/putrescine transport system permease subunit II